MPKDGRSDLLPCAPCLETERFNSACSIYTILSPGSCVCCLILLHKPLDPNSGLLNSAHSLWSDLPEIQVPGSSFASQITCTFIIDLPIPQLELTSGNCRHVQYGCLHDPRITLYSVNIERYNSSNLFQMFTSI